MVFVWIADGSDAAKTIKPIAVTTVKRPDNHFGNITETNSKTDDETIK